MLKKVVVTAALGAAVVGGGTAALASSASHDAAAPTSTSTSTTSPSSTAKPNSDKHKNSDKHRHARRSHRDQRLGRALHGTWVSKDAKTSSFVTHDAIRGTVSAISSTSITVKAADGVSRTYQVTSATKVFKRVAAPTGQPKTAQPKTAQPKTAQPKTAHTKGQRHQAPTSSIGAVKVGDQAAVLGTGTSTLTATHIVDGLKKK